MKKVVLCENVETVTVNNLNPNKVYGFVMDRNSGCKTSIGLITCTNTSGSCARMVRLLPYITHREDGTLKEKIASILNTNGEVYEFANTESFMGWFSDQLKHYRF